MPLAGGGGGGVATRAMRWPKTLVFAGVFMRALLLVIFLLVTVGVCIMESKPTGLLHGLKSRPEMVLLRLQYYEPVKNLFSRLLVSRDQQTAS